MNLLLATAAAVFAAATAAAATTAHPEEPPAMPALGRRDTASGGIAGGASLARRSPSLLAKGKNKVAKVKGAVQHGINTINRIKHADPELAEELLASLFASLKESGLLNSVIRASLTDPEARDALTHITIELVRAQVIPYREVFVALKESGLAVEVVRFSLTDAATRDGAVQLVKELVPVAPQAPACPTTVVAAGAATVTARPYTYVLSPMNATGPARGLL